MKIEGKLHTSNVNSWVKEIKKVNTWRKIYSSCMRDSENDKNEKERKVQWIKKWMQVWKRNKANSESKERKIL